jgi:hypothetical protein
VTVAKEAAAEVPADKAGPAGDAEVHGGSTCSSKKMSFLRRAIRMPFFTDDGPRPADDSQSSEGCVLREPRTGSATT